MARIENGQYLTKFPYWLPISVGLTGTPAEKISNDTSKATEDVNIIGGTTDLITSKILIGDYSRVQLGISGPLTSTSHTPMLAVFGKRDSALPLRTWPVRTFLEKHEQLRTEVLNVGPESRGQIVFAGEPVNVQENGIPQERASGVNMHHLTLTMNFTGVAEEVPKDVETNDLEFDVLVIGAFTDSAKASTGIRITDAQGRSWCPSNDYVPVWALAGRGAGQLPVMRWHEPYLLRRRESLRAAFRNAVAADGAEAARTITFECIQLP